MWRSCFDNGYNECLLGFSVAEETMPETVFIAWGRNEVLAKAVASSLAASGYSPIVGGNKPGASANTFFISTNILSQMDSASAAIILVQKNNSSKRTSKLEFRPNLMFEWGYLQRRLRADAIHVFLIDVDKDKLPTDLLNAYTTEASIAATGWPEEEAIRTLGDSIASTFSRNIAQVDFDGLEIIKGYDAYRGFLWEMMEGRKAFNPREAGYYILHMINPHFTEVI